MSERIPNAAETAALELERALLGAVLGDPPNALPAIEHLAGDSFLEGPLGLHARILDDIRLSAARSEVALGAVAARFAAEEASAYILDLYDKGPPATAAPVLAAQVTAGAVQRSLFAATGRVGLSAEALRALAEQAQARLEAASEGDGKGCLSATPFVWTEPRDLPARDWLYGRHLIRRFVSCTVAPGGAGKTALLISEALAMVSGRPLLGEAAAAPLKVWLFNGEDPLDEMRRRVAAACRHFALERHAVEGRLFLDSGRDSPLVLAVQDRSGLRMGGGLSRRLVGEIRRRGVDVMVVDPFAASHAVAENDNMAINAVVAEWGRIAEQAGCAIELVHHVRKAGSGQQETTVEDARGASALIAATRSARVLNRMTKSQAEQWSIDQPRLYLRLDNGKANLAPPAAHARWRRLVSVDLENGPVGRSDEIGVCEAWTPPAVFQGVKVEDTLAVQMKVAEGSWRLSAQCENWVGRAVAEVLGMDVSRTGDKARIGAMLGEWLRTGVLVKEQRRDPKGRLRDHVVVGAWITA